MEKTFKRLLSLVVAFVLVLGMVPANGLQVFAADAETTEEADLVISTVAELQAFAESVNNGNSYEGKLVVLANDIDMMDEEYNIADMTPIGNSTTTAFKGTFDGKGHAIKNLYITYYDTDLVFTESYVGLFGVINTPAVVKNVTVHNPYMIGKSYVGAIVGMAYTGAIENCHVTGEIDIEGYYMVGGITGHGYAKIKDCSVIGAEDWDYNTICGIYHASDLEGDNIGGIVGHNAENNSISGCTVKNVNITGTRKIGGIVGITAQSTDITDCTVENVTVGTNATADYAADNAKTMSMGGIVGQYMADANGVGGSVTDCSVSGLTFTNENAVTVNAGALTGGVRGTSEETLAPSDGNITVSGNTASAVTGDTVDYLEPAAPVYAVMIGEQGYENLAEALAAAAAMTGDVTVEIYDKVTLNSSLSGSFDSIKFVGKEADAEIYLEVQGYITATGKKVAFEDLTLSKSAGGYIGNAGFMNVAFGIYDVTEVTYTGCTFANGAYAASGEVAYTDCTFYRSHDKYGLWAYGNVDVTIDGCTFADYRGIKMYAEGAAKTVDLTVKNTDFSAVYDKPAIVLTYGESVTLEGNTYSDTGVFELDLDGAPNGTAVTSDNLEELFCENDNGACGVLVDGKIYTTVAQAAEVATEGSTVTLLHESTETVELAEGVTLDKNGYEAASVTVKASGVSGSGTEADPYLINDLDELIWFRDNVNTYTSDRSNQYVGKYVKLMADIDLAGINWTPIGTNSVGDHMAFMGTFDGNGHTISNLYINADGGNLGFFAYTGSYNEAEKAVIKNLNFHNVDVSSNSTSSHAGSYVGGVIANCGGNTYVENVNLTGDIYVVGYGYVGGIVGHGYPKMTDCSVAAEDGSYVRAYYWCAGGAIGYAGEGSTFTNVSVSGLDVYGASGAAAAVVGLANDDNGQVCKLTNVHAENVVVTGSNYYSGYVAGNGSTAVLTNVTASNVTLGSNIVATDAVAKVGDTYYMSLVNAIAAAGEGDTVTLLTDAELTSTLKITSAINLDLNDKTITSAAKYAVQVSGGNADLAVTISNGKIVAAAGSSSNGTSALNVYDGADVTVEDVELSGGYYGIKISGYDDYPSNINNNNLTSVVLNGGSVTADNAAIIGLGAYPNTQIDINGATVTSNKSMAIYHPSYGTLNITDGTITGTTAIYLKAGNLNISGGKIVANGEKADYVYGVSGAAATGDAVVIESCNYGGYPTPVVSITGGTFISANNKAVASYNTSDAEAVTGFISGGTFSSDVSAYCVDGYKATQDADGYYTLQVQLPEVEITDIKDSLKDTDPDLTFALNFAIKDLDKLTEEYLQEVLEAYGDYYTDYVITISGMSQESVTFFTGEGADGYLAGQYDAWSENWVSVPFNKEVVVKNGESLYIMETAAELMGKTGLRYTLAEVAEIVQNFDCGIYFTPEFLSANPDMEVALELKVFTEDAEGEKVEDISVATNTFENNYAAAVTADGKQTQYYATFAEALEAAEAGETVELLKDLDLTNAVELTKAITLDLNGCTVNAEAKDALRVFADVTIKNGTIASAARCINTRDAVVLNLENVTLSAPEYHAAYSNQQPLTIGGSVDGTVVNLNKVTIDGGYQGYAIISFVKAELNITDSNISGYSALYMKAGSEESVVNVTNSTLTGTLGSNNVAGNAFAAISVEDNNITVNMDATSKLVADGAYQTAIDLGATTGANITVAGVIEAENYLYATVVEGNTIAVQTQYADELLEEGFATEDHTVDGMVVVTETCVAVNETTGETYGSVAEALNTAVAGQTVKLVADSKETEIYVRRGRTLDLNGHILEVDDAAAPYEDSYIIDSKDSTGLLKIKQNFLAINGGNAQLPVWVEEDEGFRFVALTFEQRLKDLGNGAAQFKFWLDDTVPGCFLNQELNDGGEDNNVFVKIKMTWTSNTAGTTSEQYFTFPEKLISQYAGAWDSGSFQLVISGLDAVENVKFTGMLCYGDAVIVAADEALAYN